MLHWPLGSKFKGYTYPHDCSLTFNRSMQCIYHLRTHRSAVYVMQSRSRPIPTSLRVALLALLWAWACRHWPSFVCYVGGSCGGEVNIMLQKADLNGCLKTFIQQSTTKLILIQLQPRPRFACMLIYNSQCSVALDRVFHKVCSC